MHKMKEKTLCLYYENNTDTKTERAFRIVGLFELAQLKIKHLAGINKERYYQTIEIGKGKNRKEIPLVHIITVGMKAILYITNKEELKGMPEKAKAR